MRFVAVQLLQHVCPKTFAHGLRLDRWGKPRLLNHAIADRLKRNADELGQSFGGGRVFLIGDMLIPPVARLWNQRTPGFLVGIRTAF